MNCITVDNQKNIKQSGINKYQYDDIHIYVDGIIYVYGKKVGKESVDWIADTIHNTGTIPFEELRGAYTCVIKEGDKIIAFSDNSCMHCLYYSNSLISNSFLKIVEYGAKSGMELTFNEDAICEYLTIGNIYFEKTFFSNIHILHSSDMITIKENRIHIVKKGVGDVDGISSLTSINQFFEKLAYSFSDMRICQALTGGYDSRLIYACLSNKIKDHPAISANDLNNKDVKIAKAVAIANNDNLEIINVEKPVFNDDFIREMFVKKDGIEPFDIDADVRLHVFNAKLAQEYNILITGDGGVLHKDWEWIQDFPFYKKRKSNANQFYKQRLYYIQIDSHIGEKLKKNLNLQANHFKTSLDSIAKSINTQSYDSWYYWVSGNRRTELNCNSAEGIINYAPLQEMDIVRYSYALPRWRRFFFNSIRETMTKENKKIARIKTNYGTNASYEIPYILADMIFQSIEYCRKALRLIGRKLMHKNLMNKSILTWSLEEEIRNASITDKAIDYARQNGFIKTELHINDLSYTEIQRLLHIYCLYCFIKNNDSL